VGCENDNKFYDCRLLAKHSFLILFHSGIKKEYVLPVACSGGILCLDNRQIGGMHVRYVSCVEINYGVVYTHKIMA